MFSGIFLFQRHFDHYLKNGEEKEDFWKKQKICENILAEPMSQIRLRRYRDNVLLERPLSTQLRVGSARTSSPTITCRSSSDSPAIMYAFDNQQYRIYMKICENILAESNSQIIIRYNCYLMLRDQPSKLKRRVISARTFSQISE